jgi:hypothetical protein
LLARRAIPIQPQLTVNTPGDVYEQQADQVAGQVMGMPESQAQLASESSAALQRLGEEEIQTKPLAATISRLIQRTPLPGALGIRTIGGMVPDEDGPIQTKRIPGIQRAEGAQQSHTATNTVGGVAPDADIESRLNTARSGASPLPDNVRAFMEPRFGTDFSAVRVHTGSAAIQLSRDLSAQAFTHGSDIFYGAGKSPSNNELTAHELTHVVQQTGAVQRRTLGSSPKSRVLSHLQRLSTQPGFDQSLYRKEIETFQQTHSAEQVIDQQQQLLPSQAGNITQTGDRSKIFRACGDSDAAGAITHETKFDAPDGSPKTRKNVGVGEEVKFTAPKAGKWTASAGTPATLPNGATFDWTAPDRAASVTIKFEADGKESTVSMTVIEPDEIKAVKKDEIASAAGRQGAGMHLTFNYYPKKVSFGNVEAKEVSGGATNLSGYFLTHGMPHWHNSGDTFFPIQQDNQDSATDTASFSGYPKPWAKGGWDWQIPNHFRVKTEGGDGKKFTTVTQAFSMTADGESTVKKAGESVTRAP